jgi:hypothetical protein
VAAAVAIIVAGTVAMFAAIKGVEDKEKKAFEAAQERAKALHAELDRVQTKSE